MDVQQMILAEQWRVAAGAQRDFRDVGFRRHSQHDEDGILLYLFTILGHGQRRCVEICAGNGMECNAANLILHHGWTGLLVDGDADNVATGQRFYREHPGTRFWPPVFLHTWVTTENVNGIIDDSGFSGVVDLLSIDIDGVDWWLWKAISVIRPRVVVAEINHLWGMREAVTVPYRPDFVAESDGHGFGYAGASLPAFLKLAERKGYEYVGANRIGTNVFFVDREVLRSRNAIPRADPKLCFSHPRAQWGMTERYELIKNKEWERV